MSQSPRQSMPMQFVTDDLPGPNASPDAWRGFMVRLAGHRTPMNRDLVRIIAERREVAAAAAAGDRIALERVAELNRHQIEITARQDALTAALHVSRERWAAAQRMAPDDVAAGPDL